MDGWWRWMEDGGWERDMYIVCTIRGAIEGVGIVGKVCTTCTEYRGEES